MTDPPVGQPVVETTARCRARRFVTLVAIALLAASCSTGTTATSGFAPSSTAGTSTNGEGTRFPDATGGVGHVELLATTEGRVLLAWTSPGDQGRQLWLSALGEGPGSEPVLVTERATDIPLEEMRPSLAVGPNGLVAVAWTSVESDVYVALSEDGGRSFNSPFRLNLEATGLQVLPVIAFDESGGIRAVWLDPRDAPPGAEEPADLYLGVLAGDQYVETSLTGEQTSSVCGCCRPHIQIDGEDVTVTFRNTTDDGYRDPFQITLGRSTSGLPQPVAPPTWKISACPVAGPVAFGEEVVWFDGSEGSPRILAARGPDTQPDVLLGGSQGFRATAGPRVVTGTNRRILLVPGSPTSRLLVEHDGEWHAVPGELPSWATGAAIWQDRLLVVGTSDGGLVHEFHEIP